MRGRVGLVSVWHETNQYSRRLADIAQWRDYELLAGEAVRTAHVGTRSVVGGFLDSLGDRAVPVFAAGAWPSGPSPAKAVETLLDRLTEELTAAGDLDGIALNLHGAMVAEGMPDAEVEVVRRIRAVHGDIPIVAVLDLHGNPSVELAAAADALVGYKTYPHIDMWESGRDAVGILDRMLGGEAVTTSIAKLPYLTCPLAQGTADGPIGHAIDWTTSEADRRGLLSASVLAGFAYQDTERAGISVLAVSAAEDRAVAEALVAETAERIQASFDAGEFIVTRPDAAAAVQQAIASEAHPVVLADLADNIGAGSAGDGTVILAELLSQGALGAIVVIADPEVVRVASTAGVGATVETEIGGKTDRLHGDPVAVTGAVRSVSDGEYTTAGSWATGQTFSMGATVVLEVEGVTIVVTERATPPFHREHLTSVGLDPAAARILVAKGAIAWRSAYGDDAAAVIEVDAPGACPLDPWSLPRTAVPVRVVPAVTPRAGRIAS
jgi:microcystin degradation protein MlrC